MNTRFLNLPSSSPAFCNEQIMIIPKSTRGEVKDGTGWPWWSAVYGVLVILLPMMSRWEWWPARRKHQQRQIRRRRILLHCNVSVPEPNITRGVEESNCRRWERRASLTTFLTLSDQKMYACVYFLLFVSYIFLFATL